MVESKTEREFQDYLIQERRHEMELTGQCTASPGHVAYCPCVLAPGHDGACMCGCELPSPERLLVISEAAKRIHGKSA